MNSLRASGQRWWNRPGRAKPIPLALEALETRTVPSNLPAGAALAADNQVFLATVYQGELQRPIDGFGLAAWGNELNQNVSRAQVVGAIPNSTEYLSREVATDYRSLLGRNPDPSGLQYFTRVLENGATPQEVQARIMGSDEFFARVSGDLTNFLEEYGGPALQAGSVAQTELTAYRFLNAVYGEVLNRPVDATGLAGWSPLAVDAAGRSQIVRDVEASPEATHLAVATIYQDTLGRAPDAAGLAYWAGQLQQGVSQSTVVANVLGSDEFFARLQAYTAPPGSSAPNVAAAKFISAAHLFQSRPAMVPPAPPPVAVASGGDNSGFDTPPADISGGDVLGTDNSSAGAAIGDNSIPPPPPIPDPSSSDNSTTDSTDTTSTDGSCDPGVPDPAAGSSDTSSTDASPDPGNGF
jgi:hypothetical protein